MGLVLILLTALLSSSSLAFLYRVSSILSIFLISVSNLRTRVWLGGDAFISFSFLFLCRWRMQRSWGMRLLVWPGLLAYFGQFGSIIWRIWDWRSLISPALFLLQSIWFQLSDSIELVIGSQFALFRLKDARVTGASQGWVVGLILSERLWVVLHEIMVWSDREDIRLDIRLIS